MPWKNVWAVRIRNPDDFKEVAGQKGKFRTKKITDGVNATIGRLKSPPKGQENSGVIQAYRFYITRFKTKEQVTKWLKDKGVKYMSIEAPAKNERRIEIEKFREKILAGIMEARGQGMGVGGKRQGDGGADICVGPNGEEKPHRKGVSCIEQYGKGWKGRDVKANTNKE